MNMQVWSRPIGAGLIIIAGLLTLRSSSAQEAPEDVLIELREPGPKVPIREPLDVLKLKSNAASLAVDGVHRKIVAMHGQPDAMREIREAAAAVNDADDERSKRQAQERLEDMLDRYFDEDMKRRERELEEIEERVAKLSALLERRRERRREIVDLQVKVLLSEAEGMGFFSSGASGGENPYEMRIEAYPSILAVPPAPAARPTPHPPHPALPVVAPARAAEPPAEPDSP
jgi:hypothetical protein